MKYEILDAMALDMNIIKYASEADFQYYQRILYSALACWIKAAALDRNMSESNSLGASKKHIKEKCSQILEEAVCRIPEAKPYFYRDELEIDPVTTVRRRLVQNGDIVNIGFDTDMTLVPASIVALNARTEQIRGQFFNNDIFYAGISALRTTNIEFELDISDVTEWLQNYCSSSWWEIGAITNDSLEYFNHSKKSQNNSHCWQPESVGFIQKLRFLRIPINKNMYEYYIEKASNGDIYHHRIDPVLIEMKEHRRMMLAFRKIANNVPIAKLTKYTDHIKLNLKVYLPLKDLTFLESYAWPSRNIEDYLEWKMPLCLRDNIKIILENLGITVEEFNG